MKNSNKQTIKTQNLALASAISLRYPLEKIDKTNPRKAEFIFLIAENDQIFEDLVQDFWRDKLLVPAQSYFNEVKKIKARLYERFE